MGVNNLLILQTVKSLTKNCIIQYYKIGLKLINLNNIKLIVQDARDYHATSKIYSEINPDIIIHLAAVSHANKSNKDPHSTFDHSLRTLENTLDIAKNNKTHVVYLSSSMVYGNFESKEVTEETICKPIGIYGNIKIFWRVIG